MCPLFRNRPAFVLVVISSLSFLRAVALAQDFSKEVIYQIITDRFFDGDPDNNNPPQSSGMYDPTKTNWQAYWGGDLAGIQAKLPYLHAMGVTALWISPPVDNSNRPWTGPDIKPVSYMFAPYHGYGARDFQRIEEHFGSARNDWSAFDNMAAAAHRLGMKIIIDFSPNDTNLINTGEFGAVYDDGKLLGVYGDDTKHLFHHNGPISDWQDPYQLQYCNVYDLADLDQMNPIVDRYLKRAIDRLQKHGADAFRIDAVKHISWGWTYSLADTVHLHKSTFLFAEWFQGGLNDSLYSDSVKFSNRSGIPLLDYPLALATREVFANNQGFELLDRVLAKQDRNFLYPNHLVTFVDNHDIPRLLSVKNSPNRLNEAMAFVLTARGIPIVYYGDEQYLHNDTDKGKDPYNRPWMSSFDRNTVAFRLIRRLADLRKSNDALAYGAMATRWVSPDVFIFERHFADSTIVVAINKSETTSAAIADLATTLPPGNYRDYLDGLLGGNNLRVRAGKSVAGGAIEDLVPAVELAPHSASVWQVTVDAAAPRIGSIDPTQGEPGLQVTIDGARFGATGGSVHFDSTPVRIVSWTSDRVVVRVPAVHEGVYKIVLTDASGHRTSPVPFAVHRAKLIPVTFALSNTPPFTVGARLYVTGNTIELGQWTTSSDIAPGPFLCPRAPECFLDISVPAGAQIHYRYFILDRNRSIEWQERSAHLYTVPASGTGSARTVHN
ncbi:MAG: alpha-amylase family glycosyl hydrolase [Terracidiphilus sp.]